MAFFRAACLSVLALLCASAPASGATVWREGAWLLDRRILLGGPDCELRLAAPAAAARVSLRKERLEGGWEIAVFEARRDVPTDAGGVFAWRRSDGPSGEGRLTVLGVGLAILHLPAAALEALPEAGEIEMAGAGVPFVWRLPVAGLAAGLGRLETCVAEASAGR